MANFPVGQGPGFLAVFWPYFWDIQKIVERRPNAKSKTVTGLRVSRSFSSSSASRRVAFTPLPNEVEGPALALAKESHFGERKGKSLPVMDKKVKRKRHDQKNCGELATAARPSGRGAGKRFPNIFLSLPRTPNKGNPGFPCRSKTTPL